MFQRLFFIDNRHCIRLVHRRDAFNQSAGVLGWVNLRAIMRSRIARRILSFHTPIGIWRYSVETSNGAGELLVYLSLGFTLFNFTTMHVVGHWIILHRLHSLINPFRTITDFVQMNTMNIVHFLSNMLNSLLVLDTLPRISPFYHIRYYTDYNLTCTN